MDSQEIKKQKKQKLYLSALVNLVKTYDCFTSIFNYIIIKVFLNKNLSTLKCSVIGNQVLPKYKVLKFRYFFILFILLKKLLLKLNTNCCQNSKTLFYSPRNFDCVPDSLIKIPLTFPTALTKGK